MEVDCQYAETVHGRDKLLRDLAGLAHAADDKLALRLDAVGNRGDGRNEASSGRGIPLIEEGEMCEGGCFGAHDVDSRLEN